MSKQNEGIVTIQIHSQNVKITLYSNHRKKQQSAKTEEINLEVYEVKKYHLWLKRLIKIINSFQAEIDRIYISFPGEVNPYTGLVISSADFPMWEGADMYGDLQTHFDCQICAENDAVMFARNYPKKNSLNIYFDEASGIGGCINIEKRSNIYQLPVEIGHFIVVPDGEQCECGQRGCLESYISAKKIAEKYGSIDSLLKDENAVVSARYLAQVLISMLAIQDLNIIRFGGNFVETHPGVLTKVLELTREIMQSRIQWIEIPQLEIVEEYNLMPIDEAGNKAFINLKYS